MFQMQCKKHGLIYTVYYGATPNIEREAAERRAHEFMLSHFSHAPDCMLDAKITEAPFNGRF